MRIISGKLGGRNFASSVGFKTHPMAEKTRGALFNALGDVKGLTFLDPFAGTGAISFEAVSRGAKHATAIDTDKAAQKTIKENIATLGLEDRVTLISAHAKSWLTRNNEVFDVVVCDPPYNDIQETLIEKFGKAVKEGGLMVVSLPPTIRLIMGDNFEQVLQKSYGDSTLAFYRRIS